MDGWMNDLFAELAVPGVRDRPQLQQHKRRPGGQFCPNGGTRKPCLGCLSGLPTVPDVSRSRHNSDLMLIVPQCANELFINKVARETFGFSGFVVSGAL